MLVQTESNKINLSCQGIPKDHEMRAKYLLVFFPNSSGEGNISTEILGAIKRCNNLSSKVSTPNSKAF